MGRLGNQLKLVVFITVSGHVALAYKHTILSTFKIFYIFISIQVNFDTSIPRPASSYCIPF